MFLWTKVLATVLQFRQTVHTEQIGNMFTPNESAKCSLLMYFKQQVLFWQLKALLLRERLWLWLNVGGVTASCSVCQRWRFLYSHQTPVCLVLRIPDNLDVLLWRTTHFLDLKKTAPALQLWIFACFHSALINILRFWSVGWTKHINLGPGIWWCAFYAIFRHLD